MAEEMEKEWREEDCAEEDATLKPRQRSKNKADNNIEGEDKERAINGGGDDNSAINGDRTMMGGALAAEKNKEHKGKTVEAPEEEENGGRGHEKLNTGLLKVEDRTRSIHLDEEEGVWKCRHCSWIYALNGPGTDHSQSHEDKCELMMDIKNLLQHVANFHSQTKGPESSNDVSANSFIKVNNLDGRDSLANDGKHATATEPNFRDDLHVEGKENNSKTISIEDTAEPSLEIYSEDQITSVKPAATSNAGVIIINKTRSDITEFDVERILEEQDTHDLYCPNCNSCITRRVILRKRKRTVKYLPYDVKRGRLSDVGSHDGSSSLAGTAEQFHENEPEIFRCLSCFSFFIPSDSGFSIFRIFGKREENVNLQTSQVTPSTNSSWYSFIFRRTAYAEQGSDIEAPLLGEHSGEEEIHASEQSNQNISTTISGSVMSGESQTESLEFVNNIVNNKPAGEPLLGHPTFSVAGYMEVNDEGITSTEITSVSEVSVNAGSQSNIASKQSGIRVPKIPSESFTEQMEDLHQKVVSSIISTSSKLLPDKGQVIVPSKLNVTNEYDTGTRVPDIPNESLTEQVENLDQKIFSPITSTASELLPDRNLRPPKDDLAGDSINGSIGQGTSQEIMTQGVQPVPGEPTPIISQQPDTRIDVDVPVTETTRDWEILKSIVYGGLVESITSLGVVSSAAGADAATLNIVALGLANLIGGLFVISHDLSALKNEQQERTNPEEQRRGRYLDLLGRRENFLLHAIVAVLSYIIFGLLPPVIYGFSFYKSDNKEYKLMVVAGAAVIWISLLALAKAHVGTGSTYFRTVVYYLGLGYAASGLSYVAGVFINRLLEKIGLFNQGGDTSAPASFALLAGSSPSIAWSSY